MSEKHSLSESTNTMVNIVCKSIKTLKIIKTLHTIGIIYDNKVNQGLGKNDLYPFILQTDKDT